ncbi:MAG: tetratricopeptide repeat protein [Acidobacteria bacterium]|nr:tetratricopeptide repeat protein [Acidobacteriota bacterium]
MKERAEAMKKNAALNQTFNEGMTALQAKQWDQAVAGLAKASELDPKQHVVWAQLAEAYIGQAGTKSGADRDGLMTKGLEAYAKALELKPDDAAYHNNYALALVKAKKIPEAQAELTKAAQINPAGAGQYYYNLGAVLTNTGQTEPAGDAFKKAIEADPNYAEAYYQYALNLVAKAQMTPDGKINPPAGTREAFEKYIELKKEGPNVDSAKQMLASLGTTLDTQYKNPKAPPPKPTKKGRKK